MKHIALLPQQRMRVKRLSFFHLIRNLVRGRCCPLSPSLAWINQDVVETTEGQSGNAGEGKMMIMIREPYRSGSGMQHTPEDSCRGTNKNAAEIPRFDVAHLFTSPHENIPLLREVAIVYRDDAGVDRGHRAGACRGGRLRVGRRDRGRPGFRARLSECLRCL